MKDGKLEELTEKLKCKDPLVHEAAVREFKKLDPYGKVIDKAVWNILDDDKRWVMRVKVSSGWSKSERGGEIKSTTIYFKSFRQIVAGLQDKNPKMRMGCARALSDMGRKALEPLIKTLEDENPNVRAVAATSMGKFNDPRVVELLLKALKDNEAHVRRNVARALAKFAEKEDVVIEALIKTLEDGNLGVRVAAATALRRIDVPQVVRHLSKALEDGNPNIHDEAVEVLGKIDDPRVVEPLLKALKDEKPNVRAAAAKALGKIDDPRVVEPLLKALKDNEADVRKKAAWALAKFAEKEDVVIETLIESLGRKAHYAALDVMFYIIVPSLNQVFLGKVAEGVRGRLLDIENPEHSRQVSHLYAQTVDVRNTRLAPEAEKLELPKIKPRKRPKRRVWRTAG